MTPETQKFSSEVIAAYKANPSELIALLQKWGYNPSDYGYFPDGAIIHAYLGDPNIINQLDGFDFKKSLQNVGNFLQVAGKVSEVVTPLTETKAKDNVKDASNAEYLAKKKKEEEDKKAQNDMYLYLGIGTVIALVILFLVLKPKK